MSILQNVIDPLEFRQALGNLPTGVVIMTAQGDDGPVGMSCNSFTSVSLEPPLIGIFPAKTSSTWPEIRKAGRFCINVAALHHDELTRNFSRKGVDRFAGVEWTDRASGPGLADAVAWIDCEIYSETDAGDHTFVLGRVTDFGVQEGVDPLVFHRGSYGSVGPHPGVVA